MRSMRFTRPFLALNGLGLNGVRGPVDGFLYASRSVKYAMLAHMGTHAVSWAATPLPSALGL
jgi:hypothetical protein